MKAPGLVFFPLVLIVGAVGVASCTAILGDFTPPGSTGQGGGETTSSSQSSTSASTGGGGSGGAPMCKHDKDCPDPSSSCLLPFCDGGVCASKPVAKGMDAPTNKQVVGDCKVIVCEANGSSHVNADTSDVDDDNPCTTDKCDADGTAHHDPLTGHTCSVGGGKLCNSLGNCVGCLAPSDCPGNGSCSNYSCEVASCSDNVKNQDETDIDCGGMKCPQCVVGKKCSGASDCASDYCQGGVCRPASCMNGMLDMGETDVDCGGGGCDRCATGKHCTANANCGTNFCQAGLCRITTCDDGMKDLNETGTDCGGVDCQKCPAGQGCLVDTDCASGVCDTTVDVCD